IFGMTSFSWNVNLENATGNAKTIIDNMVAEVAANTSYNGIRQLYFNYNASSKKYALTMRVNKVSTLGALYGTYEYGDNTIKMTFTGTEGDNTGLTRLNRLPTMQAFLDFISSKEWIVSTDKPMGPEKLLFTNSADPADTITLTLR
ncbi:MAG: hypothetical protein K2H00_05495, partial [Muribaculum intestinale]|nr:hypothetical protein [Muribaculum intestinale]